MKVIKNIIYYTLICILVISILISGYALIVELINIKNEHKEYEIIEDTNYIQYKPLINKLCSEQYDFPPDNLDIESMNNMVNAMFGRHDYLLLHVNNILLQQDINGMAITAYHTILLRNDLKSSDYMETLTHELIHLYYSTANDVFCEFMAFKYMFESGNNYLKTSAVLMALEHLGGDRRPQRYDASKYIAEYLKQEFDM